MSTKYVSRHLRKDPLKSVPFGIFLISISLTFILNPNLPSDIIEYLKSIEVYGRFIPPSPKLLLPVADFSIYFGIGLILLFVFRIVSKVAIWAASENFSQGIFFIILNRLIINFVKEDGNFIIFFSLCLITLGIAIIIGEIVGYAIKH
ncbi:MAG: hypothetical protein N3F64_05425 [Nitrososphaeria archaeon]|nr:hypothetical protein [Nitrososphaeria archaeon]